MAFIAFTNLMPSGTDGIIKKIRETVGDGPVYLSIDVRRSGNFLPFILC